MSAALDRIRALNPQYNDIPDAELVPILHQEFSPNKPIAEVYKNLGISDPENEAGAVRSYGVLPLLKGVSNIGGVVGYGLEKAGFEETGKELQESDVRAMEKLSARQSQQAREDAAKTIIDKEGNYGGYNPGTLVQDVLQSLPGMAVMGAVGAPIATGVSAVSKAAGVGKALKGVSGFAGDAEKLDQVVGSALGFGASEGAFSGAQNASQVQQQIYNTDYQTLATSPQFQEAYHNDTDAELPHEERLKQAKEIVAQKAGDAVFAQTLLETGGTSALTGGGIFGMMRGKKEAVDSILKSVVKGFFTEGGQEAVQSGLEQRTQNQAIQQYANPKQDVNESVLNAILQGGMAGGALGGGGGFFAGGGQPTPPKPKPEKKNSVENVINAPDALSAIAAASEALDEPIIKTPETAGGILKRQTIAGIPVQEAIDRQFPEPSGYRPIGLLGPTHQIEADKIEPDDRSVTIGGKEFPYRNFVIGQITSGGKPYEVAKENFNRLYEEQNLTKPEPVVTEQTAPETAKPVVEQTKEPAVKPASQFTPTHELNNGTPVIKVAGETNVYADVSGNEWEADDALPIAETKAPIVEQKTKEQPKQLTNDFIPAGTELIWKRGDKSTTIKATENVDLSGLHNDDFVSGFEINGGKADATVGHLKQIVGQTLSKNETPVVEPKAVAQEQVPAKKLFNVNGTQVDYDKLTPEQQTAWDEADAQHALSIKYAGQFDKQNRGKIIKAAGMELSTKRREITGNLTSKEQESLNKKESVIRNGDAVSHAEYGNGIVKSNPAYGKTKVQFGNIEKTVNLNELTKQKEQPTTETAQIRKGKIGGKLSAGEIVTTTSGRQTTPFPKFQTKEGNVKPVHLKAVDKWLMRNAFEEAKARGDEFNARQFESSLDKPSQADKESAEEYLFGEQPEVKKPILKPLETKKSTPINSAALKRKADSLIEKANRMESAGGNKDEIKTLRDQAERDYKAAGIKPVATEMEDLKDQMGQAIGELASLLGGKTNLTEEEETKLIPIMSKIFRIAAKMGYVKFKDAAQHVMSQIRELAGDEVADKLSIENLQAGYINIAKEIGGDKREALQYESIEELEGDTDAKQKQKTTQPNGSRGAQSGVRKESENTTKSGAGIRESGQEERDSRQELVGIFNKLGKQGISNAGEKLIKQRSDADIITAVQSHWLDVLADVGYEKESKSDNPNGKVFIQC